MLEAILPILQSRIPGWDQFTAHVTPLGGGITNQNFKLMLGNQAFVVRLCAKGVDVHGINRQNEFRCAQAAAETGIAPQLIAFLTDLPNQQEALVTYFVEGTTATAEMVRAADRLPQIVDLLRQTHGLTQFAGRFDVFRIFDNCLAAAQRLGSPLPTFIDQVQADLQRIEQALQRYPVALVACHNDLLPTNFLISSNVFGHERLWLLDWEYAGWGDPFFDLGNLSVNNEFDDRLDQLLLSEYFGEITSQHWACLKLMKIISDAREGIWGAVQWGISPLDFDYADYCHRHLARFMHNAAAPEVESWIKEVSEP